MAKQSNRVGNWIRSSDYDIRTAESMFKAGRYIYVLFMCHLSCEKLLKALYEAVCRKVPPKTHNLIYLSNAVELQIPENHLQLVESLNDLSVVTRYPEDFESLVRSFRKRRVEEYQRKTKAFLRWLRKDARLEK